MHFFPQIILGCLIDASCAPLSTFLPKFQHSNSRLDGRVGNLVSGRVTRLVFLCWGDKEILTESYHRAWVMRDSGASVDLFFPKSLGDHLGEKCSELIVCPQAEGTVAEGLVSAPPPSPLKSL